MRIIIIDCKTQILFEIHSRSKKKLRVSIFCFKILAALENNYFATR